MSSPADAPKSAGTIPVAGALHDPHADWRPRHSPMLIALAVALSTFMEVLDTSIANVALKNIAGSLSAGMEESTWVLTSYLVSNGIVLPMSAWFSSFMGRKNFYMLCVAVFTLASIACGMAPTLGMLVFCRVLQGIGGGGLQPSAQAILMDSFPVAKRGIGMAIYGIAVVVAPIIGPTLGGWITDNMSWHWVFFINVPVGLLSLFMVNQLVEDPPYLPRRRRGEKGFRLDYIGFGLIALGLGTLQIVLDKGQIEDWFGSRMILTMSIIAGVLLLSAIIWEWRFDDPVVDLRLLKERNFVICTMLMFMLGFVLFGSTVLLPLYLQSLLGYTATMAGLALSPGGVVTLIMMPVVGILVGRMGPRWLVASGLLIVAISLWQMSYFTMQMDYPTAVRARMMQGLGLSLLFVPINTAAYGFLPRHKNNNGASLLNLARNLGGGVGIAVAVTLISRHQQVHQSYLAAHITIFDPQYRIAMANLVANLKAAGVGAWEAPRIALGMLNGQLVKQAMLLAYVDTFRVFGGMFLAMIPLALLLKRPQHGPPPGAH